MNEFITTNSLVTGVVLTISVIGGVYFFTKKNIPKIDNKVVKYNKLKDKILEKLIKLEENFIPRATSFYLRLGLLESKFSKKKQKEILLNLDYPKVISEPKVEWNNFLIVNEEGNILNELLKERIKNYPDKDSYTIKASFNYMLLEKAEEKAKKIIKEKESQ